MMISKPISHIVDNIFIGERKCVEDEEGLKKDFKIAFVLNCAKELEDQNIVNNESFSYMKISMCDDPNEKIIPIFYQAHEFIKRSEVEKSNILVHCNMGVSRSVSIVISYLMKFKQMNLKASLDLVVKNRPVSKPNVGYFKQLMSYEIMILQEREQHRTKKPSISLETYKFKYYYVNRLKDEKKKNVKIKTLQNVPLPESLDFKKIQEEMKNEYMKEISRKKKKVRPIFELKTLLEKLPYEQIRKRLVDLNKKYQFLESQEEQKIILKIIEKLEKSDHNFSFNHLEFFSKLLLRIMNSFENREKIDALMFPLIDIFRCVLVCRRGKTFFKNKIGELISKLIELVLKSEDFKIHVVGLKLLINLSTLRKRNSDESIIVTSSEEEKDGINIKKILIDSSSKFGGSKKDIVKKYYSILLRNLSCIFSKKTEYFYLKEIIIDTCISDFMKILHTERFTIREDIFKELVISLANLCFFNDEEQLRKDNERIDEKGFIVAKACYKKFFMGKVFDDISVMVSVDQLKRFFKI